MANRTRKGDGTRILRLAIFGCFLLSSCGTSSTPDKSAQAPTTGVAAPKGEDWFRFQISALSSQFTQIQLTDVEKAVMTAKSFCVETEDDFKFSNTDEELTVAISLDDEGLDANTREGKRFAQETRELLRFQRIGAEAFCPEHL